MRFLKCSYLKHNSISECKASPSNYLTKFLMKRRFVDCDPGFVEAAKYNHKDILTYLNQFASKSCRRLALIHSSKHNDITAINIIGVANIGKNVTHANFSFKLFITKKINYNSKNKTMNILLFISCSLLLLAYVY